MKMNIAEVQETPFSLRLAERVVSSPSDEEENPITMLTRSTSGPNDGWDDSDIGSGYVECFLN